MFELRKVEPSFHIHRFLRRILLNSPYLNFESLKIFQICFGNHFKFFHSHFCIIFVRQMLLIYSSLRFYHFFWKMCSDWSLGVVILVHCFSVIFWNIFWGYSNYFLSWWLPSPSSIENKYTKNYITSIISLKVKS